MKVCPKEGTRVRILGMYHDTAYGAVGHRGGRGRGVARGVDVGEQRNGIRQMVPELVRGTWRGRRG